MILLDTHVLLWSGLAVEGRLGPQALGRIDDAVRTRTALFSVISLWEIDQLHARGRLELAISTAELRDMLLDHGFQELELWGDAAIRAGALLHAHRDPADRFLMAQAQLAEATLLTADRAILAWPGPLSRQHAGL